MNRWPEFSPRMARALVAPLLVAGAVSCSDPARPAAVSHELQAAQALPSVSLVEESAAEHRTLNAHGFDLTFYPGFASRATIREADGTERELFRQTETYRLPNGKKRPDSKHVLRLKGGTWNQDVTLRIDDPQLRIARIRIELYEASPHGADAEAQQIGVQSIVVVNDPRTCPPDC